PKTPIVMAEPKTRLTDASVADFLHGVDDEQKRADCFELVDLMSDVTGEEPKMWGDSIVGFGTYHYKYASGREGDWMQVGFSPRKQSLTLYIMSGFSRYDELMKGLGKFKTGKSCLYVKRLSDVDRDVLRELIAQSVEHVKKAGR
ncbi:MAG: DUF1801 domain-containing protein, partial [Rhodothermales bacterium]|nr:DUF1801 domain-containing protein [Rhodothermales bacterium]